MKSQWNKEAAAACRTPVDELIYASRLIGLEPELVVWGGGNSSVKAPARDFRGRDVTALHIKASGSNMRTLTEKNVAPLDLEALLALRHRKELSDEDMVAYLAQASLDRSAPRPSIETLLHAFVPAKHVYHVHSDAIVALTNTKGGRDHVRAALGEDLPIVPYMRPGFGLSKAVADVVDQHPKAPGVVLAHHGLITWGDTAKQAYERTIKFVDKAERYLHQFNGKGKPAAAKVTAKEGAALRRAKALWLLPVLRGKLGPEGSILHFDDDPQVLKALARPDLEKIVTGGPATPDHLMHTRPWPLVLPEPPTVPGEAYLKQLDKKLAQWAKRYEQYTRTHAPKGSLLFPPYPRVVFVPGLGLIGAGKNQKTAAITHDIALRWLNVMNLSANLGNFKSIAPKDIGDFEYWPMENYKLTLAPPEKPFSRQVVIVGGAGGAIGSAITRRLHADGAQLVLTDLHGCQVSMLARELNDQAGDERVVALGADLTKELDVFRVMEEAVLHFGGVDGAVFNAGIALCAPVTQTPLDAWERVMSTNATSHFLLAREVLKVMERQLRGGWMVFVGSKNVAGPGKDFCAYSVSKAALTQLARVLAVEAAPMGVRVNVVSPDGIFQGSGLWDPALRRNRAKTYGIEETDLEDFYRQRNLLKHKVSGEDVAEAVAFLASPMAAATTGSVLPVDGGVKEAFTR